jgi:hypothetical protein
MRKTNPPQPRIRLRRHSSAAPSSGDSVQALVHIDQAPLRDAASRDCLRAYAALEKIQVGIRQYEEVDLPAYSRWVRGKFAGLLGRIRETAEKVADLEFLVESVERVAAFSGCSYQEAYEIVMEEKRARDEGRARPDSAEARADEEAGPTGDGPTEDQLREAFDELFGSAEDDPDFDPEHYQKGFDEFKRFFRKQEGREEEEPREEGPHAHQSRRGGQEEFAFARPAAPSERDLDLRLKDRYRKLARILHPDLNEPTARKKELWLQVQDAYERRDLHGLDELLLLADLGGGGSFILASLSEMLALVRRLKDSMKPLKRQLREVRRSPAWEFTQRNGYADLELECERDLQHEFDSFRRRSGILEKTLSHWARPLGQRRGARRRTRPERIHPSGGRGRGRRSSG